MCKNLSLFYCSLPVCACILSLSVTVAKFAPEGRTHNDFACWGLHTYLLLRQDKRKIRTRYPCTSETTFHWPGIVANVYCLLKALRRGFTDRVQHTEDLDNGRRCRSNVQQARFNRAVCSVPLILLGDMCFEQDCTQLRLRLFPLSAYRRVIV